jgi:hypothetical protein
MRGGSAVSAVVITVGAAFLAMGLAALVRPAAIPAQFGSAADTADARTGLLIAAAGWSA